jgi:uncharacterized protein (DUF1501 family)
MPKKTKASASKNKTLILLELDGGNDGLNTVVPYGEKNYHKLRPNLAIKKENLYIIDSTYGLNKNLRNLNSLYNDSNLAIIHGLGYDEPNFSHFRSIQIVETASLSNEYLNEGWLANSLSKFKLSETKPAHALLIGRRKKGYLFSKDLSTLQFKSIDEFTSKALKLHKFTSGAGIDFNFPFLNEQKKIVQLASDSLYKYVDGIKIKSEFKDSDISNSFKEAVKIIKSDLQIPLIKISQKGYDTHANQMERQELLLRQLDDAIGSFIKELKRDNLFDDILIVTYSEFGRRVKENGSLGTDHGTASSHFVIGGNVRGGMYGKRPSLDNLYKDNLIYTTHYRTYYNTILSKWFNNKDNKFNTYDMLNFL